MIELTPWLGAITGWSMFGFSSIAVVYLIDKYSFVRDELDEYATALIEKNLKIESFERQLNRVIIDKTDLYRDCLEYQAKIDDLNLRNDNLTQALFNANQQNQILHEEKDEIEAKYSRIDQPRDKYGRFVKMASIDNDIHKQLIEEINNVERD